MAERVKFEFDRIAVHYDFLNHLFSLNIDRLWRRKTIKIVADNLSENSKVLDVAIGTADLSLELLRFAPETHIVGIDLSEEMMKLGRVKVEKKGLQNKVEFVHGSALNMPFEDESFDVVMCAFGVRNFSDLDKGLKELYRVLRKDGRLLILEFSYPSNRFVAFFYDLYFSHVMPFLGRLLSRDKTAYTYLNRSVKGFVWGEKMLERLRQAGFVSLDYRRLTFGISSIYMANK